VITPLKLHHATGQDLLADDGTTTARSPSTDSPRARAAIRVGLEKAGVEFIAENGGGPGVCLRKGKE
jgi:hypothetical protein